MYLLLFQAMILMKSSIDPAVSGRKRNLTTDAYATDGQPDEKQTRFSGCAVMCLRSGKCIPRMPPSQMHQESLSIIPARFLAKRTVSDLGRYIEVFPIRVKGYEITTWDPYGQPDLFQRLGCRYHACLFIPDEKKTFYQKNCERRITDVFNNGLLPTLSVYEGKKTTERAGDMMCHTFANFISFGTNFLGINQAKITKCKSWYDSLPFGFRSALFP